ncbi:rhomboid family intramembrane serine protease [Nordella sp. HKS 07]|uniref:rhomboid family intramembrane serine protease n=1 Tax=Nordella sp. HKS 07 TaxID=2712222 RepID=UPI0013E1039D|nr:rhomboid family intramembrane serine protease [Nordella sp. HKS 07]QIG51607.1 rhomboid family intramembrane serine protease [Nordella sp. HKS 07]
MPQLTNGAGGGGPRQAGIDRKLRSGSGPVVNAPPVVLVTIGILIAIHVAILLGGHDWQIWTLYAFALIPARFQGPGAIAMIEGSQYWSLVTYAFLHEGWLHVLFNSLWLLVFGTPVARQLGTLRFLLIALVSALGGAFAMLILFWGTPIIAVGASAAVSGLLAAAIPIMFGGAYGPLSFREFLRDRRAIIFLVVFLVMTLASSVQWLPGFADGARIAWEAHLGGFVAGLFTYFVISREGVRRA